MARAFVVSLALVVLAMDVPHLHEHREDGPAIYNEQCALARLALGCAGLSVQSPVQSDHALQMVEAAVALLPAPRRTAPSLERGARAPPAFS